MNLPDGLLSEAWILASWALFGLVLLVAVWKAPWREFLAVGERQHVFLGACLVLVLLWSLRADVTPGVSIHFLGMTAFTLMFGWALAVLASAVILAGYSFLGMAGWEALALNALVAGVLPALVSDVVRRVVYMYLPHNFFIYIFLSAFAGAMLAALSAALTLSWVMWGSGLYDWSHLSHDYLRYLPLILFPEGVLNGMLITTFVVIRPQWVRSFDDADYIVGK